jgi:5-methylcytosine-specific restriction endonuclease McrA
MVHKRRGPIVDLFNDQSGICCYCTEPMVLELGKDNTATIDHIVPKSKGGPNKESNYAAACFLCNSKKGNMPLLIFLSRRLPMKKKYVRNSALNPRYQLGIY